MTRKKIDIHNYDDIINMPRHVSKVYPQMSIKSRAAQFAPFAALTGHKEAITETERITENKRILDENQKEILDRKLRYIIEKIHEQPSVRVIYYIEDYKKDGGNYTVFEGNVKTIVEHKNIIAFEDGLIIKIDDIYDLYII